MFKQKVTERKSKGERVCVYVCVLVCVYVCVLVCVYVCVLVKQKVTKRGSEKVCLSVFSRDSREKIYPDFQGFGRISRLLYDYSMLAAVEKHGNYQKILD